ncbi:NCS1 family nucleobase:cation symporter-1 [Salinisphaera sp.]|uniref:NCS1 family nucleobase:cation symporter-1 n=1 Tax=Salinisphaera sp. TaxID=1914330 RepID=UPI002D78D759|nr:NCS1 family nucleobase:cation symporter-1 [Salinisphaera sp.]HET7313884.1 NCS1 family nucleobase:cation symporter-1 [Salinisphaera sp.]
MSETKRLKDLALQTDAEVDEVCDRVRDSRLYNEDLAPAGPARRTWHTWHIMAMWLSISVVITTYTLASGLMASGMNWWQALMTVGLANLIVLIPMILNAHVGVRYGIPFPVFVRSSFGTSGANFAALSRAVVACGWFGIQTWLGGLAVSGILTALWPAWADVTGHTFIAFFVFWAIQMAIIVRGMETIKIFESWAAPLLIIVALWLLVWGFSAGGGPVHVLQASESMTTKSQHSFWSLFWPGLAANVGYWATLSLNIPDFTRFARSQRSQTVGQIVGLPVSMIIFSFIGIATTAATVVVFGKAVWNPVDLVPMVSHNPFVLVVALVVIAIAQISTNMAANTVAPSNDFSNVAPKLISFRTGGLITGVIGVLMFPWALMDNAGAYIFTWLGGYGSLLGAIAGIMIADYWLVRRRNLNLTDLYRVEGEYPRWNWPAFVAMAFAIIPVIPGFIVAASTPGGNVDNPSMIDSLFNYGWFFTFGVSVIVYWLISLLRQSTSTDGSLGAAGKAKAGS